MDENIGLPKNLNEVYSGLRVLVTGDTGFKGSWLCFWLKRLGAEVYGYALPPMTTPNLFNAIDLASSIRHCEGDIRDRSKMAAFIKSCSPSVIFHLAAQPLVRRSYLEPHATFETNAFGTLNLLETLREVPSVKACVVVTTDKCYENREWPFSYREDDKLGGVDPYSASKACAELIAASYRDSFFALSKGGRIGIATARAGNVIGGGDWSEDRLIPDCVKAFSSGRPVVIRNPLSVRPWQHVLEPLYGYILLAANLLNSPSKWSTAWNFAPYGADCVAVREIADMAVSLWDGAKWEVESKNHTGFYETKTLRLDNSKACLLLGWRPVLGVKKAMEMTFEWYLDYYKFKRSVSETMDFQISFFEEKICESNKRSRF